MHLELSNQQFKKLLELMYVGNFIISCNKDERGENRHDEDEMERILYDAALNVGLPEVEDYQGKTIATEDFGDQMYHEIDEYCEEETWRKLAQWLSDNELSKIFTKKEWEDLTDKQRLILRFAVEEKFVQEFEKHGLDHVKVSAFSLQKEALLREARKPEPILPRIRLKHFGLNEEGEKPTHADVACAQCKHRGISVGSVLNADTSHPRLICEDCTIDQYQRDYHYNSREAAAARRRRMFDVPYLFQEMVLDEYVRSHHLSGAYDMDFQVMQGFLERSQQLYNDLFERVEKLILEETVHQNEIEKVLSQKIKTIDWKKYESTME